MDIGNYSVKAVRIVDQVDSLVASLGFDDLVSLIGKYFGKQKPDEELIFDNQNAPVRHDHPHCL